MTDLNTFEALAARAGGRCELCGGTSGLTACSAGGDSVERSVFVCDACAAELASDTLDPKHWFCLKEAIWSGVPAVQVVSYRLLHRLRGEQWASELFDSAYLADDVLAWANEGLAEADEDEGDGGGRTVDCNGNELADGDSVTLIRNLDVKGAGFVAKQGTRVNDIRLTDNPKHVEGRINKVAIVLKTEFLKKA